MARESTYRLTSEFPLSHLDGILVTVKEELSVVCFLTVLSFNMDRQTDRRVS